MFPSSFHVPYGISNRAFRMESVWSYLPQAPIKSNSFYVSIFHKTVLLRPCTRIISQNRLHYADFGIVQIMDTVHRHWTGGIRDGLPFCPPADPAALLTGYERYLCCWIWRLPYSHQTPQQDRQRIHQERKNKTLQRRLPTDILPVW